MEHGTGRTRKNVREVAGAELKRMRTERGVSQRELAARAGIEQCTVSKIENGSRALTVQEAARLCYLLDEDPSVYMARVARKVGRKGKWPTAAKVQPKSQGEAADSIAI